MILADIDLAAKMLDYLSPLPSSTENKTEHCTRAAKITSRDVADQ